MAYFSTDSFLEVLKTSGYSRNNSLSFYHLNAQSLRNKGEEVEAEMKQINYAFDFFAFTETWFRSEEDVIQFTGYKHVTQFRKEKRGGGVTIYTRQNLSFDILTDYTGVFEDFECVSLLHRNIFIIALYRPPQGNTEAFLQFIETCLENANSNKWRVIALGDFNIDVMGRSPIQAALTEIMLLYGCTNTIESPTRVNKSTATIIDLCYTNFSRDAVFSCVFVWSK